MKCVRCKQNEGVVPTETEGHTFYVCEVCAATMIYPLRNTAVEITRTYLYDTHGNETVVVYLGDKEVYRGKPVRVEIRERKE